MGKGETMMMVVERWVEEYVVPIVLIVCFVVVGWIAFRAMCGAVFGWFAGRSKASMLKRGVIRVWPAVFYRERVNRAVVDHARALVRMNMPMAEGFMLAGQQTPGRVGTVLQVIGTFLQHGMTLSEAYGRYRSRSAMVLSLIAAGEQCGQLSTMLDYAQETMRRQRRIRLESMPQFWPYAAAVMTMWFAILSFVMWFVVPKFKAIAADFGASFPESMQVIVGFFDWLVAGQVAHVPVSLPGWVFVVGGVGLVMWMRLRPRRWPKITWGSWLSDRCAWMTPGVGRLAQYEGLSHAAAVIRVAIDAGLGMDKAIACVAQTDINAVLRRKFQRLSAAVVKGEAVDRAGLRFGLPVRFMWAIRPSQDMESLGSSLRMLEQYYGLVISHWVLAVRSLVWPAMVLGMAAMVGGVAYSIISFMTMMIQAVAEAAM